MCASLAALRSTMSVCKLGSFRTFWFIRPVLLITPAGRCSTRGDPTVTSPVGLWTAIFEALKFRIV